MTNRKIKGATSKSFNNIQFKSQLEVTVYKTLLQAGFEPSYEHYKFIIWEGFKPEKILFYNKDNKTKMLKLENTKIRDITYTPDFIFKHKDILIIIEAKGFENDIFPVKKKLFRKVLEEHYPNSIYFEIFTKKQLLQAINIIKAL